MQNSQLKKNLGIAIMTISCVLALFLVLLIAVSHDDPILKSIWGPGDIFGILIVFVLLFFLFQYGRKIYKRQPQTLSLPDDVLQFSPLPSEPLAISGETFTVRTGSFKEAWNKVLPRIIVSYILSMVVAILISFAVNRSSGDISLVYFVVGIMIVVGIFGTYRSYQRQKELFESFSLIIDEYSITRVIQNTRSVTIKTQQITKITKAKAGNFIINGVTKGEVIYIPAQIDHYEKVLEMLEKIRPVTLQVRVPFMQRFSFLFTLLSAAAMAGVYISKEKWIVAVSGTIVLSIFGWSGYKLYTNKNVDNRTKRFLPVIILVALAVAASVFVKLTN